ncbi:hypothetical protein [Roseibium aggregatum]|uniref:hypothetical protein n=1 Tax=Roseibium aggregatum TaxID=187304 RepID=UPI00094B7187|nr:hypothetical protein [Roseibium aggregatum]UFI04663.1 hypothetical protein ST40_005915 [Roseibium aggregatum]
MTKNLPEAPETGDSGGSNGDNNGKTNNFLAVGTLHYHGNDLTELRKIAEINPELAKEILEKDDKKDNRANVSYRFAIASSLFLVFFLLLSVTLLSIYVGLWSTFLAILLILAIALLIRVILTGEWSETGWFGKAVGLLAKALGSEHNSKDD